MNKHDLAKLSRTRKESIDPEGEIAKLNTLDNVCVPESLVDILRGLNNTYIFLDCVEFCIFTPGFSPNDSIHHSKYLPFHGFDGIQVGAADYFLRDNHITPLRFLQFSLNDFGSFCIHVDPTTKTFERVYFVDQSWEEMSSQSSDSRDMLPSQARWNKGIYEVAKDIDDFITRLEPMLSCPDEAEAELTCPIGFDGTEKQMKIADQKAKIDPNFRQQNNFIWKKIGRKIYLLDHSLASSIDYAG